jgi:hypothetical protein
MKRNVILRSLGKKVTASRIRGRRTIGSNRLPPIRGRYGPKRTVANSGTCRFMENVLESPQTPSIKPHVVPECNTQ